MNDVALPQVFIEGEFNDLPADVYHEREAMSASGAKKMLQSPAHYRLMRTQTSTPTDAMRFGTAVHCGVLEPDCFLDRVAALPAGDKRTKDGKIAYEDFLSKHFGKIHLTAEAFYRARRCIDAVLAHPGASKLLNGARTEVSFFWRDARYNVPCKARWDIDSHGGCTDLKTTQDASPEGFGRQIANLLYHVAAAHYLSAGEHVRNETPRFFAFIAVESEPPYAVACYVLPGNAVLAGAHLMNRALERYRDALAAGEWQGYPETIETIQLPKYALRFDTY